MSILLVAGPARISLHIGILLLQVTLLPLLHPTTLLPLSGLAHLFCRVLLTVFSVCSYVGMICRRGEVPAAAEEVAVTALYLITVLREVGVCLAFAVWPPFACFAEGHPLSPVCFHCLE